MEKIRIRLILEEKDKVGRTPEGNPIFTQDFFNKLTEWHDFFEKRVQQYLDTFIGENEWSITFREFANVDKHIFEALIYGNDVTQFDKICSIINYNIPELKFHFYYGSPLNQIHNQ